MTVKELIEVLSAMNQDALVFSYKSNDFIGGYRIVTCESDTAHCIGYLNDRSMELPIEPVVVITCK